MSRFSTFRMRAVALLAATTVLGMGGVASAQVDVEECIAQNGPRYDTPSDATTAQYIDTGGLCRDAASGGDVSITPIGGRKNKGGPGAAQGSSDSSGSSASQASGGVTSGTGTPAGSVRPAKPRTPPSAGSRPRPAATPAPAGTSSATVQRALAVADASGGASPPEVSAMPAEVVVALLGAVALGGLGLTRRLAGRR